ncbi:MAG: aminotransferase class III-fold pyridoxal phosphate-dependent enzyme [Hyphomicrobiaceae bacterium]
MQQLVRTPGETTLIETANTVLPAGTFGNSALDVVIAKGKAGRIWDVSGNEYVDYLLGSGPMVVGHAHPEVTAAVNEQVANGTTFFVNNPHGIRLAAEIVEAIPCAEQVRFVCTGTEADMYAMRVGRAFTKREKILKFEGGYHGMSDYSLMSLAPKRLANFPTPVPDSAGIPKAIRDEVIVAPYNDLEAVRSLVAQHKDEIAAIIVEPFQRLIGPKPGFLEGLRKITEETGIVLIFDEVVTGFRWAYNGAQSYYGVTPDIATFGKVIGGGFPLAAIAGRADIMKHFNKAAVPEDEFTVQIGTLSGNPVASAAGLATMEILKRPGAYEKLWGTGRQLMDALGRILKGAGIPARIVGEAPMFDVVFTEEDVTDYRSYFRGDADMARRFNAALLRQGVLKSDGKYYISIAHDERDVAQTIAAWEAGVKELRG